MAIVNSNEYAKQVSTGLSIEALMQWELGGKVRIANVRLAAVVAQNDEVNVIQLPPNASLALTLSYVKQNATAGAGTTWDLGWLAHTKADGTVVAKDVDGLLDGIDATVTSLRQLSSLTLGVGPDPVADYRFESREPVTIILTALGAGFSWTAAQPVDFQIAYRVD